MKMNLQYFAEETKTEEVTAEPEQVEEESAETKQEPEKKYTDEDVNKLINKKFAELEERKQREIKDAARKAKLSEKELLAEEIKERDEKLAAYERKEKLGENAKIVSKTLSDANLPHDDDLIELLVKEDEDETKLNVQAVLSYVSKLKKESARQATPNEGGAFNNQTNETKNLAEIAAKKRIIK